MKPIQRTILIAMLLLPNFATVSSADLFCPNFVNEPMVRPALPSHQRVILLNEAEVDTDFKVLLRTNKDTDKLDLVAGPVDNDQVSYLDWDQELGQLVVQATWVRSENWGSEGDTITTSRKVYFNLDELGLEKNVQPPRGTSRSDRQAWAKEVLKLVHVRIYPTARPAYNADRDAVTGANYRDAATGAANLYDSETQTFRPDAGIHCYLVVEIARK